MLVPSGTHVLDRNGKSVGTVSRLVMHPETRQVVALVVHQGVIDRREVVVPLNHVASFGDEVRLDLRAADLAGLDLFDAQPLRPMPDHWPMPTGFDQRSFFLVGGDSWAESVLPFQLTSPAVSGTPAYVRDPDAPEGSREPAIAATTPVYDNAGQRVGEVDGVELDPVTGRITRVVVRRGRLFHTDTPIPASAIAAVGDDRITLGVGGDELRKLGRTAQGRLGTARAS